MGIVVVTAMLTGIGVSAEIIDRALAAIGSVVITQSEVTAALDLGLVKVDTRDDQIAAALSQVIDRQLMLVEVDRYAPPEPSPAAIAAWMQTVRDRFGSAEAYDAALRRTGFDEKRLRQQARMMLRIEAYLDQRFGGDASQAARRAALIADWVKGLRRRSDVSYLNIPRQ
jgi:hypothetical protein